MCKVFILKDLINFLLKKILLSNPCQALIMLQLVAVYHVIHGKDAFKNGTFSNNIISLRS